MRILISNGTVITDEIENQLDILIEDEKIVDIGKNLDRTNVDKTIDATGKWVLPGIIDSHVHFHMPVGETFTADDFESGSIAALQGGVTTVIDFATPFEGSIQKGFLNRTVDASKSYVDYTYHMEVVGGMTITDELIKNISDLGMKSIKIYTTYGSDKISDEQLEPLFKLAKKYDLLVMIHAEDDDILKAKKQELLDFGSDDIKYHGISRPIKAEVNAIKKMIELAKLYHTKIYIAHVSTKEGAELIKQAQDHGYPVLGETCPHYFLLDESLYDKPNGGLYVMSPPLRSLDDKDGILTHIQDGSLSVLSTDHCAFHYSLKETMKFTKALSGIPGVESLLPLSITELVQTGYLSIKNLISALAVTPAKLFGIYPVKGTLLIHSDADIVIYNPNGERWIDDASIHSKAEYSVFDGRKVKGSICYTIRRGEIVVDHGSFTASKLGQFIKDVKS